MKPFAVLLLLSLYLPAALAEIDSTQSVEATTAITLPVDSVTIYPDGLMAVKRTGMLDVTEGTHKFVVNIPDKADQSSVLLYVSNATTERVVYEADPIYTLNILYPGSQTFDLSYLMYYAAAWEPLYDLHLRDERILVKANALVSNGGGEELKDVRLKLVAGLSPDIQPYPVTRAMEKVASGAMAETEEALYDIAAPAPAARSTGELETLYIFELEERKDLPMDKEIGFPLFEVEAPLLRVYTWDASYQEEGPASEEIRMNNTLENPWPSGKAMLYNDGEYVSTIEMPYTPPATNASIIVGTSADLTLEKKLADYNRTEQIKAISTPDGNRTVKETREKWNYTLEVESNLDRPATLEVTDRVPREAVMVYVSPEPSERTATSLKWELDLLAREKMAISYAYQVTTTESLGMVS